MYRLLRYVLSYLAVVGLNVGAFVNEGNALKCRFAELPPPFRIFSSAVCACVFVRTATRNLYPHASTAVRDSRLACARPARS